MSILSSSQLAALRQRNNDELRKGKKASYGYPVHTINDLLQTIDHLKKEKKKWQRVATDRKDILSKINDLTNLSRLNTDLDDDAEIVSILTRD